MFIDDVMNVFPIWTTTMMSFTY